MNADFTDFPDGGILLVDRCTTSFQRDRLFSRRGLGFGNGSLL